MMKLKPFHFKISLYSKLVATYFAVICLSFVLMAVALSKWFENYYYNERKQALLSEETVFNSFLEGYYNKTLSSKSLTLELSALENLLNTRIWIIDRYKLIVSVSNSADQEFLMKQITEDEINEVLRGNVIAKEGVFKDAYNTPVLTVAFPLKIYNQISGAAIMNSPMYEITGALRRVYMVIWFCALFAIIISTFIIYYFSQRIIVKPLYEINKIARKISGGEFEKRVNINSNDEIGQLAESFNSMADSLQNLENLRRDFIANISHELRSPITSIKGFVQGILDGTIPEDKQKHYLAIVLDESRRLTRLISDVLDLSRLESGEFSLKICPFDLNELIRLTIIRFEREIDKKKLDVDVILSGDSLFALGDRDRIGQVISNLIDNAIKFTPDKGKMGISTRIDGKKIIVSVSDTGTGIPEDELKLIWDRFHMVDKSRTTKKGTGLGLSIARQIINQHGEKIWAESKEGQGSVFSFTMNIS